MLTVWHADVGTFDPLSGQGDTFPDYTTAHMPLMWKSTPTWRGEGAALRRRSRRRHGDQPDARRRPDTGGAMQGIGYALTEEIVLDEGVNNSTLFTDYRFRTRPTIPTSKPRSSRAGRVGGPFGARGIGEPPIGPSAPALANAITNAISARPMRLPMTPERVLALIDRTRGTPWKHQSRVNLNADMGEGFGAYDIGNDEAMLSIIGSASIACGKHAGDPNVMYRVVERAHHAGVSIGAHPGFDDLLWDSADDEST